MSISERDLVTRYLGRKFYTSFCEVKRQEPWSAPYVPRWAKAYAVIAVDALGWDDETLNKIRMENTNDNHVAQENNGYTLESENIPA